ncbi:hypothetical protein L5515_004648 [Caenorhabditis briggsae]|uniref:Uncharacterized protein n=1 Tax=Caenorhabditis briggsae TaxID=6238 RepID=A0AAE9JDA2_CAEBR|nr:hypothetical protein L5515_004648 [Caenorhabditis briggsae]
MKARQLDRSSKEVEGPKTQVKMKSRRRANQVRLTNGQHSHVNGSATGVSAKVGIPESTTFGQDAVTKRRRSSQRQGHSSHVICQADRQLKSSKLLP